MTRIYLTLHGRWPENRNRLVGLMSIRRRRIVDDNVSGGGRVLLVPGYTKPDLEIVATHALSSKFSEALAPTDS